jgi:hypothetical protein
MSLKPTVFGPTKIKGECIKQFVCAKPNIAVGAYDQVWAKCRVAIAKLRIDPVCSDDEVGIGKFQIAVHVPFKGQFDAQLLAARLQNVQQFLAPDANKAVTAGAHASALDTNLDIVPMIEGGFNLPGRFQIAGAHVFHGCVRKYHSPSKRIVGAITLDDLDPVVAILLFHQQTEIETGRTTANANDAHAPSPLLTAAPCPADLLIDSSEGLRQDSDISRAVTHEARKTALACRKPSATRSMSLALTTN